jgi:hypothetical protein
MKTFSTADITSEPGNYFECLSKEVAYQQVNKKMNNAQYAGFLCPADPKMEPPLLARPVACNGFVCEPMPYEVTSTIFSSYFESDKYTFGKPGPHAVDRFAYYNSLGLFRLMGGTSFHSAKLCPFLNENKVDKNQPNDYSYEFDILGTIRNEKDAWCSRLMTSYIATSACPKYGVAVTGVCQSLYDRFVKSCLSREDVSISVNLYGTFLPVVPDDTQYCIKEYLARPTGWTQDVILGLFEERPYHLED